MRRMMLLAVAGLLASAAPAGAQAISTATPNVVGKGSRLHFQLDATLPPVDGRIPSAIVLKAAPGFTFNPSAVAKRCTPLRASLNECPSKARFGSGALVIHVDTPDGARDVTVPLKLYLRTDTKVLTVAFLAGTRVVPAVIDRSNGLVLRFDPLPSPPPFQGVSYAFRSVSITMGTSRRVRRNTRIVRVHLIRNPRQCVAPAWDSFMTLGFPDATSTLLPAPMTCAAA